MSADAPGPEPVRPRLDFGIVDLTDHWQTAFDAAETALRAATADLPHDEIGRRRQALVAEEVATLGLLQSFAREHFVSPPPHLFFGPISPPMLGLPSSLHACVFELDGVLANSAAVHRAAWGETFAELLFRRSSLTQLEVVPFDPQGDYDRYIDGRPRLEGVREFLASSGISLPAGHEDDPPDRETVHGLANRKNAALQSHPRASGRRAPSVGLAGTFQRRGAPVFGGQSSPSA